MSDETLLYEPLDVARKEIRLLKLPPLSNTDTNLSFQLITVSLLELPPFSSLSYVWGKGSFTEPILLNGVSKEIGNSLASALRHISYSQDVLDDDRLLWADAICINQDDLEEKKYQVPLMKDIYGSAKSVISWLGTHEWLSTAFETLQIISQEASTDSSNLEWLRRHRSLHVQDTEVDDRNLVPNRHWRSFHDFLRLEYWSRMWIFQEIALSQRLILAIPERNISVEVLSTALTRTRSLINSFADPKQARPDFIDGAMWKHLQKLEILGDVSFTFVERLIVVRELLSQEDLERNQRPSLCILSAYTHETDASDKRDIYYGLIGVSQLELVPDYGPSKSIKSVCVDFVRAYLEATRDSPWTLLFLHDALGQRGVYHQLPSWTPMYHLRKEMEGRRRNPDPKARAGGNVFNGLPGKRPPKIWGRALRVFGACITTVDSTTYRPSEEDFWHGGQMATYLLNFVRKHGPIYKTGIPAATALFATLQENISGSYDFIRGLALLWCLRRTLDFRDASDAKRVWSRILEAYVQSGPQLEDVNKCRVPTVEELVREWAPIFASFEMTKRGQLFETPEGYLGVAPLDAREGDQVCILDKAVNPLALRQNQDNHMVIGECFVLGLMTGEVRSILVQGHARAKDFWLV